MIKSNLSLYSKKITFLLRSLIKFNLKGSNHAEI